MATFRVTHPIAHIRQPSQNDCWAAATAMARGRDRGRHLMVSDVKQIASDNGVRVNVDGTLPVQDLGNTRRLATALNMQCFDVRMGAVTTVTVSVMKRYLERGRLALFGFFDFPRLSLNHVITVYRMWGDGTPTGTTISIVDPFNGRADNFSWKEFNEDIMADPHFVVVK
ncbi:papain-like cysteine protease family protein [Thalassoglobus sp. JC818]|uniref:papain-like cysteine protease family protein n=1 Tax=Thalassoglobus sp. JC818 TaxID=3232136 RepID=UPI003458CDD6